MANNPWDVMRELAVMQDRMNRIWGSMHDRGTEDVTSRGTWQPPVDIYENEAREIVLRADLAGLRRDDIDLTVENNTLTIRGERRRDERLAPFAREQRGGARELERRLRFDEIFTRGGDRIRRLAPAGYRRRRQIGRDRRIAGHGSIFALPGVE